METVTASHALNQLLAILVRSFPSYLSYAKPWSPSTDDRALATLDEIVAEQGALAGRIASAVLDAGGQPEPGDYPMEFTDAHDLSLAYLLRKAVLYQQADIAAIERCAKAVRDVPEARTRADDQQARASIRLLQVHAAPEARALTDEALAMARKHLAMLEALITPRRGTP